MADIENNSALSAVTSHVEMNGSNEEVTHMDGDIVDEVGVGVADEEMLQNPLVDPSSAFPTVEMQYSEETEALQDGVLISNGIQFINDTSNSQENTDQLTETFVTDTSEFINDTDFVNQSEKSDVIEYQSVNENSNSLTEQPVSVLNSQVLPSTSVSQPQIIVQQHVPQSSAPLGSSQNPIRIIQQGNQYTPVQQLSTDQLQQIMQVVQQQQINKNVASGSSVLFNPQTNTRIVYRVIYPSQLHKDGAGDSSKAAGQQTLMSYIPQRRYKKRKEEETDKIEGPELSKEEKEQRKRMRPKTRSGRVSKPPKHMVKDFKHIHVLDYDEDYDDSDGGYSDFKYEGEDEPDRKDDDENFVTYAAGVDSMKPKKWKCITCEKAYIGRAGLARHLRLNPSHGTIDIDGDGDMEPPDPSITPVTGEDVTLSTPATPNGINSTANSTASFSEDSRDSSVSLTYTPAPRSRGRGRGRAGRGSWRGRGAYSKVDPETRRLNKLKEITKECSDEELMEIVLPRLAKVITLWEFLLMKVEKGNPAWPHADDIYKEYIKIHEHVKKLCQEYFQFVAEPEANGEQQQSLLQVENTDVAQALGLHVGPHKVREIADTDTDIQYKYKFLTTNQSVDFDYTNKSFLKRTVEVVSPEQIVSPAKKLKQTHLQSVSLSASQQRNLSPSEGSTSVTSASDRFTPSSVVRSVPFKTKIEIISPQRVNGKVSQCSNSGKPISGKAVSLLANSFSKHSSSSSLSSSSSSYSSSSDKSSQKVIIVSGTNSTPQSSASAFIHNSEPSKSELPAPSENQSGSQLNDQSGNQYVTLSNGQGLSSQNRIILHDNVTGTYTVCSVSNNLTNSSQATNDPTQISSSEPVILSLPSSSNPQLVQPKLVLNDMNLLNSVPSETSEFQQIISSVTGENIINRQILNVKTEEEGMNSASVQAEGISVTDLDPTEQNLILTLPNGDPVRVAGNDQSSGNVVYALTNGDSSQENVIFTVDPSSMLVTQLNGEQSNEAANEVQNLNGNNIVEANEENEIVGVIDSIDTSEQEKLDTKWEIVQNVSPTDDDLQMNGDALINDASLNEDEAQLAAVSSSENKLNNIGPKGNTVSNELEMRVEDGNPEETIQIPATNIYQSEDGTIFIQNPDGTTLQLQGPDGQAVSMETVQALLGMVSETSQ